MIITQGRRLNEETFLIVHVPDAKIQSEKTGIEKNMGSGDRGIIAALDNLC